MFGRRRGKSERPAPEWSRNKMLALLIAAGVGVVVLLAGLVLFAIHEINPTRDGGRNAGSTAAGGQQDAGGGAAEGSGGSSATDPRDLLAARPMRSVSEDASHPSAVSSTDPGVIALPASTATGRAQVPTGFPRTPDGAMAQLAAIDQVAFQSGSLSQARRVIEGWAVLGGPNAGDWSVIQGMAELFNHMDVTSGSGQLALVLTPLMGQVKGGVGPDFTIPCVDFELDVTLQQTARGASADCQRMAWQPAPAGSTQYGNAGGRWVIAAGFEPATAPSVWPDTDLAIAVGYHDLRQESK